MSTPFARGVSVGLAVLGASSICRCGSRPAPLETQLPQPVAEGSVSVEHALATRRSVRAFTSEALTSAEIGQLAWAAQGITDPERGYRTAPSAGALYPLEIYLVHAGGVDHYVPASHTLVRTWDHDVRRELADAALGQDEVRTAPLDVVVVGYVARTRGKYGDRAERFVPMEAGHAAENVLLQARAMGLGAVPIGGFVDAAVLAVLHLGLDATPYYVIPVGHPAR